MFSEIRTGTCWRPLCTAIVSPTMSGRTIERLDHVLIGRRSFFADASATFFARCESTNGPFLTLRGIFQILYLRLRRRTIILSVRLFLRVFAPLVGVPQGLTGCRPPEVRPSPPPCG